MKQVVSSIIGVVIASHGLHAGDIVTQSQQSAASATLRDLEADRPDATESPRTVDKGYFQIETSLLGYGRDSSGGVVSESWTWGETNLKYGLTDSMDLQLIFAPYVREVTSTGGMRQVVEGGSDVTLRLKYNLWGNDDGDTALAIFPYVKIPTGTALSNDKWEGGVIIPWACDLTESIGFGMQVEFARVWDDAAGDYDWDILHTAVLGFDVTDKLGLYLEYLGVSGGHPYEAYASGGVTWAFSDRFQWDAGVVIGINQAAEDLNTFTGFTLKF
ncbi:MAG: transporter [Akkermansiaceae bacterium]